MEFWPSIQQLIMINQKLHVQTTTMLLGLIAQETAVATQSQPWLLLQAH